MNNPEWVQLPHSPPREGSHSWSSAAVLKTAKGASSSWVRIPPLPQVFPLRYTDWYMDDTGKQEKPREVLLSWSSPSRLFKKRDKEYFTNIGAIVFLLIVILIFAREFVLIAAVVSIVFLIYVLSTVPPEEITNHITNLGIESASHFYRWDELAEFWFEEQWGQVMLIVRPLFGSRIIILLGQEDQKKVRELIAEHIPYRDKPQKTWADNAASWLSNKVPLEKPNL
jgi:hypothetical protein